MYIFRNIQNRDITYVSRFLRVYDCIDIATTACSTSSHLDVVYVLILLSSSYD